jgi:hypothetical protein
MKNLTKLTFAIIFASILFAGCSNQDNPVAPVDPGNGGDPDPVVINTPITMKIDLISVKGFSKNKTNGDPWDWNPLLPTEQKPDIYVILQQTGNHSPSFWSDRRNNATYTSTYVFTVPKSGYTKLPRNISYGDTYKIYLKDSDFPDSDDSMGSVSVKPSAIYGKDNATKFDKTLLDGAVKIRVKGTWIYE